VSADRKSLLKDDSGAAMLEFTAAAFTFFIMLFGIIEFSNVFYQWNAATKAVQLGARLAAVSDPVSADLANLTGLDDGVLPGDPMPPFDFTCTFGASGCDDKAIKTIAYGRCDRDSSGVVDDPVCDGDGVRSACNGASSPRNIGMCNIFPRIAPGNVVIRYQYTGLGYAGRPGPDRDGDGEPDGGAVPTITVSIRGIPYDFIMIGAFLPVQRITMPGFATTVTGEDLAKTWSG